MTLEEENEQLKEQLALAQKWMQREVISAQQEIRFEKDTLNYEAKVAEKIQVFFPPDVSMYLPEIEKEHIISSECIFLHMQTEHHIDGTGVIIGYQKVLDTLIEDFITKGFRKYILKNNLEHSPENIPLEKALHSIISQGYIFSLGRLYESLKKIREHQNLPHYLLCFKNYVENKSHLQKALLESDFFIHLEVLINLHAVSEKRHEGTLFLEETSLSRKAFIGNFEEKNCLLYILLQSQSVEI